MPIRLHLTLFILLQFVGLAVGFLLSKAMVNEVGACNGYFPVIFIVMCLLGVGVPRLAFRFLIPADCPKCGGGMYVRGGRPITYHCRSCGYIHETKVSEGSDDLN